MPFCSQLMAQLGAAQFYFRRSLLRSIITKTPQVVTASDCSCRDRDWCDRQRSGIILSRLSASPRLFACSICISPVWPGVETGTGPGRSGLQSVALLDSLPVRKQASLLDWNRLFGADLRERCCHIDQSTALLLCPHRVAILTIITSL